VPWHIIWCCFFERLESIKYCTCCAHMFSKYLYQPVELLGRIACIAWCGLLRQMSHVAWSVCLYVCLSAGHTDVLRKNGWTDRDIVWGLTHVGPRNHVLDECQDREGAVLGGCPVSVAVYAANGIIQSIITARHAMACGRSSKFFDQYFCSIYKLPTYINSRRLTLNKFRSEHFV